MDHRRHASAHHGGVFTPIATGGECPLGLDESPVATPPPDVGAGFAPGLMTPRVPAPAIAESGPLQPLDGVVGLLVVANDVGGPGRPASSPFAVIRGGPASSQTPEPSAQTESTPTGAARGNV